DNDCNGQTDEGCGTGVPPGIDAGMDLPTMGPDAAPDAPPPNSLPKCRNGIISAGDRFACYRHPSGKVYCWGTNFPGLGDGSSTTQSLSAVEVAGLTDAVFVSAGEEHACAVRRGGHVVCWGANSDGQ